MTALASRPPDALAPPPSNPYVGPRAFREEDSEIFFGRDREAVGLVSSVIAGRIVLMHSPSGAGKTSLLQASVVPAMQARGFEVCATREPRFSALRVNSPVPSEFEGNRYIHSVVLGLMGEHVSDPAELRTWTIARALDELGAITQAKRQLVVLDQFEEILTTDPADQPGQREFFMDLGTAIDHPRRWVIIAMREDFMGGLDRYLRYLPGQLRTTFRLDLLDQDGALRAIQQPATQRGVQFTDKAAAELVADLRMVDPSAPGRASPGTKGGFVEPVLLQVVCDNLWRKLSDDHGGTFNEVTEADVAAFRPIDIAIDNYYSRVIRKASKKDPVAERAIRDWVQDKLLTSRRLRAQTTSVPEVADVATAMRVMTARYLIREDPRPNGNWYELTHDMLIRPIIRDNDRWREVNLEPWQITAYRWDRERYEKNRYLLSGAELRAARANVKKDQRPTQVEMAFLEASAERYTDATKRARLQERVDRTTYLLVLSVILNVMLIIFIVLYHG